MKIRAITVWVMAALAAGAQGATVTWDDGAADDLWSSGANWDGLDVAPTNGDSVVLTATPQSSLDYGWTIESGQSLTTTAPGFGDELVLQSDSVLTLATGGAMDIGFMRPRFSSGGQFVIEPGANLDTDNYGLSTISATITFIADTNSVTTWNNAGAYEVGADALVVDLSSYDITNGTTLVLVDYDGGLSGTFASFSLTNSPGWAAEVDYAYDQGGGNLAIALTNIEQFLIVTWDDGAADDNWSSGANWDGLEVAPTNGDSVVLAATAQSQLDYGWTIENGRSLTTTAPDLGDELVLQSDSVLTLATGGAMDIGFMRPRFSSGGQFVIEPGATLDTDNYGLSTISATITFIADTNSVTTWNNPGAFETRSDHLVLDLSSYDITNGTTLVLVDYGGAITPPFSSTNLTAGWSGTIDYAYDQGGGDLAIALTNLAEGDPLNTSNGTPISWLDLYNLGTNGTYEAADLVDSDLDGRLNWEEYRDGTHPTGGGQVEDTVVTLIEGTNGTPDTLTFDPPDFPWIIEASTNLVSGDWGVLPGVTFITEGDGTITANAAHGSLNTRTFYRLAETGQNTTVVIFLTEGQSNMVGASPDSASNEYGISDLPLRNMFQLSRGHARFFYDAVAENELIQAFQPLQSSDATFQQGDESLVSLDFYFARAYAEENSDEDVLIIKNAVGGSGFANNRWNDGDSLDSLVTPYFQGAFTQSDLTNRYDVIRFGGILWHQGEADTKTMVASAAYASNLTALVTRHRSRVAGFVANDAPFVLGTMHYFRIDNFFPNFPFMADVDAVHRDITNLVVNAEFADLHDLQGATDIHFTVDEYKTTGERYYLKWLEVATDMGW